jgi:cytochrome b561
MALRNTTIEYGWLAKALHWIIAIGLIALIYLGLQQAGMERGDEKSNIRFLHASIATVMLILMTIRIIWRFMNEAPAKPDGIPAVQGVVSALVHWGLYLTVFAQLFVGALMSGTNGYGLPLFGVASIPLPIAKDEDAHHFWEEVHEFMWKPVAFLVVLHVLGALYNHFVLKNDVLRRMTSGLR